METSGSAIIITDVFPYEGQCAIHVDHQGSEYRVCWKGDWRKCPDFSTFPHLSAATATEIPHGPATRRLWSASRVIGHGSNAHVRQLLVRDDDFPIIKVAINARQRELIAEEFQLLRHLAISAPSARIPLTHPEPLREGSYVVGFRMERLHCIPLGGHLEHFEELEDAVRQLHSVGIVHHDLSPSNIMMDKSGRVTLIDLGHAGYLGQPIPARKAKPGSSRGARYSISDDERSLVRLHSKPGGLFDLRRL
jgi:protein kinase-like protein